MNETAQIKWWRVNRNGETKEGGVAEVTFPVNSITLTLWFIKKFDAIPEVSSGGMYYAEHKDGEATYAHVVS